MDSDPAVVSCPQCGHDFEPGSDKAELERALRDKFDHSIYDDASYTWWKSGEVQVKFPHSGAYIKSLGDADLPDGWSIEHVWSGSRHTKISVTKDAND